MPQLSSLCMILRFLFRVFQFVAREANQSHTTMTTESLLIRTDSCLLASLNCSSYRITWSENTQLPKVKPPIHRRYVRVAFLQADNSKSYSSLKGESPKRRPVRVVEGNRTRESDTKTWKINKQNRPQQQQQQQIRLMSDRCTRWQPDTTVVVVVVVVDAVVAVTALW